MSEKEKSQDQVGKFKRAARDLGCDEDEAAFDRALRDIARRIPSVTPPKYEPDEFDAQSD